MSFKVEPAALRGYAVMVGRASDDAQQCREYFAKQVPDIPPGAGGLINPLSYEHASVRARLDAMLTMLVETLATSQHALVEAAAGYDLGDRSSASRLDDSCPVVERPPAHRN